MGCIQSHLPQSLSRKEVNYLSLQSQLTIEEIEQFYSSFIHCYPYGYLNEKDFIEYYQDFHHEYNEQFLPLLKQFFQLFDLNEDHRLDFSEFVLFNVLIENGSINDKIQLIFRFYSKEKLKSFSRDEIKEFLRKIFDLLDIPSSKSHLMEVIEHVFQRNQIKRNDRINWKQFTDEILHDQSLFEQLISFSSSSSQTTTTIQRSERF